MKCEMLTRKIRVGRPKRQGKRNYHRQVVKEGPPTKEQLNNHARRTLPGACTLEGGRRGLRGGSHHQKTGLDPFVLLKSSLLIRFPQNRTKGKFKAFLPKQPTKGKLGEVHHDFLPGSPGDSSQ